MSNPKEITDEQYKAFYEEIYARDASGRKVSRYRVPLDQDPSIDPMSINKKLSEVQSYKDRMVVILNDAIQNESYWKAKSKNLDARFDSEVNGALTTDSVKNAGNAGLQRAVASRIASNSVVAMIFNGEGSYEDHAAKVSKRYAEAAAFLSEVKNLYENLEGVSMSLAIQLKSMMMNARLGGVTMDDMGGRNGR